MLLATIGYPVGSIVLAGCCAFVVIGYRLGRRRSAPCGKGETNPRVRVAALGGAALLCGPLLGLILAFLICRYADVDPLDVGYTYRAYVRLGSFVGFLGGVSFAAASLILNASHAKATAPADPDF